MQHFQERFVMHPVPTFSEIAVREALLNAVSHRDYRHPGSVFVRQFPRHIEIVSPGGFPLASRLRTSSINNCPATAASRRPSPGAGWSNGQAREQIGSWKNASATANFCPTTQSDPHQVWITLNGEIRDENFLKFLERVGQGTLDTLDPHDFLILGLIVSGKRLPADLQPHVPRLLELGILDRTGHGKPILAKRLYSSATGALQRRSNGKRSASATGGF